MPAEKLYFEIHIAPMFREIDRRHMLMRFDLWSYKDVVANKDAILLRLLKDMPTDSTGGTWPVEWTDLFKRWKDTGSLQLERGLGTEYGAKRQGGSILLTAKGQVPSRGYNVWFEFIRGAKTPNQLVLYQKPPAKPPGGPPISFSIKDTIPDPGPSYTSILLEDKNGIQTVPIT
jgi:hypothetical protein